MYDSANENLNASATVKTEIIAFLKKWENAWEQKELETYMTCYASTFSFKGQDREAWEKHRKDLNEKTPFIELELSNRRIFPEGEKARVTFVQNYHSANYSDYGIKQLELMRENNEWKIRRETWSPLLEDDSEPK